MPTRYNLRVNSPTLSAPAVSPSPGTAPEATRLRDLSPRQWKSGIAAWLGWLFDGLDMHLYTLVAAPFVAMLLGLAATDTANDLVKQKSSWIQAAFLIGWALGGGFFGRVGDRLGRSRALCLTVVTYALFTGLSFLAQTWWQLMIFRFLAALGIGGEWAVGSTLLSETWPKKWRPWIAAVLQMGVNLGILLACLTGVLLKGYEPRYVFLVGIVPALLVFWIRRHVPEPEEWHAAKATRSGAEPGVSELFRGPVKRTTWLTIGVCATSLTGWWAFMFWHPQHLMNLPELQSWTLAAKRDLVAQTFAWVIGISIIGNYVAGALAQWLGYRKAIALMFAGIFVTFLLAFGLPHDYRTLTGFLAAGHWLLVRRVRSVHNVPAAAVSHPAAHHRRGILLQHRPHCRRFRDHFLRCAHARRKLPANVAGGWLPFSDRPHRGALVTRTRRCKGPRASRAAFGLAAASNDLQPLGRRRHDRHRL